jgi:hypothetical protein
MLKKFGWWKVLIVINLVFKIISLIIEWKSKNLIKRIIEITVCVQWFYLSFSTIIWFYKFF